MGYYTKYNLSVNEYPENKKEFFEYLENFETVYGNLLYFFNNTSEDIKWYDHDNDIKQVSKDWPDLIFVLKGNGEDTGDLWVKYYKNGKSERHNAVITYPESKFLKEGIPEE